MNTEELREKLLYLQGKSSTYLTNYATACNFRPYTYQAEAWEEQLIAELDLGTVERGWVKIPIDMRKKVKPLVHYVGGKYHVIED